MSTTVLKVKIHCEGCGKKVKNLLKKIRGVSTVTVDVDHDRVTIVATVDQHTLIAALSKAGIKADPVEDNPIPISTNNNLQIVAHSKPSQSIDQRTVAQLHQLSEIEGLQNVEVTYSKTYKLTFKGQKDEPFEKDNNINKVVYINGSQVGQSGYANGPQMGQSGYVNGSQMGQSGYVNGPSMGSRGPCCAGHVMSHCCDGHYRVCNIHNPYGDNNGYYNWAPPGYGFTPPPTPPPPWQRDIPSAPPAVGELPNYDHLAPPPPIAYPSYSYIFSDERSNSCKIM